MKHTGDVIDFNLWRKSRGRVSFVRGPLKMRREQWHRLRNRLNAESPQGVKFVAHPVTPNPKHR